MRIEGVTSDLKHEIDFSEWNWGDLETSLFKPLADQIAEVLWDQIVEDTKKGEARITMDYDGRKAGVSDGELVLHVDLIEDDAVLVIPLREIVFDNEGMWLTKNQAEFAYDFEPMLDRLNEARAILRHWDEQLERVIAETMDEMEKLP